MPYCFEIKLGVLFQCESPVLATVRDELTKQLLDHQGKLETSLREQQQELKLLKHQLGAPSSSDSTNPQLQALEVHTCVV